MPGYSKVSVKRGKLNSSYFGFSNGVTVRQGGIPKSVLSTLMNCQKLPRLAVLLMTFL